MADTLANVKLPQGEWVNLYTATGIVAGTLLQTQNIGQTRVQIHTGATEPTASDGFNVIEPGKTFFNQSGSLGEWAISRSADGSLNVGEA